MKSNSLFKTNIVIGFVLIIGFMLTAFFGYQANYQSSLNTIEHVSTLTSEGIYYQLTSMFTRPVNISLTMAHDSFLKDHLEKEQEQFTEQSYIETLREYLNVYKEKYSFAMYAYTGMNTIGIAVIAICIAILQSQFTNSTGSTVAVDDDEGDF